MKSIALLLALFIAQWQVPPSVLERYVGEYVYPDGETVTVRLEGNTLFRVVPGQQVPLVPFSNTLFRLGPVFTAEFVIGPTGEVTQILTDGVDVEYRLRRKISGKVPPAARAAWRSRAMKLLPSGPTILRALLLCSNDSSSLTYRPRARQRSTNYRG